MRDLVQVTAPHFCAVLWIEDGKVVDAAPILKWTVGKGRSYLTHYFRQKGWKAVVITHLLTKVATRAHS